MPSPCWTITYLGTEQSAASWGLTSQPRIRTRDRSPTEISFRMAGAAPEGAIPFPFKSQVIIKQGRTFTSGSWGGGGYVFTGYQTTQPADVDGRSQGITLVFKDALWLMQNTVFQQLWNIASTPGSPDYISRCVLFMDINSWVPNVYQSVQWQINQIISYAASCGIAIAPGTIDYSGWFLNYYHCRAISCWEALLKCLEPIPDAKVWVDGSGTTPVLNVRTRANLSALPSPLSGAQPGPITLPYKGCDSAGRRHFSTHGFTPRYDLIPPQVVLQYQINGTYNGKPAPSWTNDVYPASVAGSADGQMPFAMVCPIDLLGAAIVGETGQLDCEPLACVGGSHYSKRVWWSSKRGGEQDKLTDYRVRFGSNTLADATVVDDNGNPINLALFPNRIVQGAYHTWMSSGGSPVQVIRAHVKVSAQFSEYDVAGSGESDTSGNLIRSANAHDLHCHVTLTNAPAGVTSFVSNNLTAYAESPVPNLAQNIFLSRSLLDYDGTHEIIDPGIKNGASQTQPLSQIIGHWNVLNFSGGASAWATANMTISGTEIDLQSNHIRIEVGPSKHLQPQDWSSMLQFFRYRRVYLDSSVRATGYGSSNNQADMAHNTPDANTVPGLAVDQKQSLLAPDAITSGLSQLITHDATTGQITVAQQPTAGGSAYTTGLIPPIYNGSGSPASSTLAASAYYRVNHLYLDTIGNALWVCTTAGSNSTSVWAQLGGGASMYHVKDDLGSSLRCRTWNGTTEGSTDVFIAKKPEIQSVVTSVTMNSVTYTLSYALGTADTNGNHYLVRTVKIGSVTNEIDDILPPFLFNDVIYAIGIPSITLDSNPCTLMDTSSRSWGAR